VRLRPLTEAECYARCYGGHGGERVPFVRVLSRHERDAGGRGAGERLRRVFEERLDAHGPEVEAA
jgi:hypothetical protein